MTSFIRGYEAGANITILNAIYHKSKKDENGKYSNDSIDIIFKDLDTGEKKVQNIQNPKYTYWMVNEGVPVDYNRMFIEKKDVHPIECCYKDLKKSIAESTGNIEFFYDNLRSGNYRENDRLFYIPSVFNADMNIEDYYRWMFDRTYKNQSFNPSKLYFDIEVDSINMAGDFPELGECPVNAVTLVDDNNKHIYTLLLENYNNPLIEEFKKIPDLTLKLKDFVRENVGGWKNEIRFGLDKYDYAIMFYDEEIKLIVDMFNVINTIKPDFALAWNIAFDLPYLIERIRVLGYDPIEIICHKDFKVKECEYFIIINKKNNKFEERGDYSHISCYTVYLDQLISFASRRKGQRAIPVMKLDFVGQAIAGVRKLDYSNITRDISKLPYLNYYIFAFYNVMDTIVQLCVEHKVGDVDFVFNKALAVNTRYSKVHRQTTYLINRAIKDFWDMGYIVGNNINKRNEKEGFAGAYVGDPLLVSDKPKMKINGIPVNLYNNLDDFDFKALYPSIIDENNMAPNTQIGKIILPEKLDPNENRFNNSYFNRSVYFVEDYVCGDALNFCERYLHLASYEQMFDDIINYFATVKAPRVGLRNVDTQSNKLIMVEKIPYHSKVPMVDKVDNTTKIKMVDIVERMPKYEKHN